MNDIRQTLDLLEAKKILTQPPLKYGRGALAPVLSKTNIDNHYGKLYKGYVDRYNSGEGDKSFNEAGAFLHDIWFTQLQTPKNANSPHGTSLELIDKHFGNFLDFKEDFKTEAMKIQGSGWVYLSRSGHIKTIRNHQIKNDIALLVDWWEHSWVTDYGADKKKYLNNIWRIINWDRVNRRIHSNT